MTTSSLRLPDHANARRLALAVAVTLPTALTWLYFIQLADAPAVTQRTVYVIGKTLQFALPVVFVTLVLGRAVRLNGPSRRGLGEGVVSGLVACLGTLVFIWLLARHHPALLASVGGQIGAKATGLGIATLPRFLAVAVFYSLAHSALEEYYWRWFVYGQLRRFLRARPAIWLGALAFMAHHVLLVGFYTGWHGWVSVAMAAAVALGGAYWAWLYERSGSLAGPWISHLLVDAAIFAAGWNLIHRATA